MSSPTVRRRRLSAELIRLREAAGLTIEQAAKRLDWSRGRLTYMETNRWTRPDLSNIRTLLDLYGVSDQQAREAILDLARESRKKGWWAQYSDVFHGSLPGFEAGASRIRTYEAVLIPGLLQTEDYARVIFRGGQVLVEDAAVERRVKARLARQAVLQQEHPPEMSVVIDEAALRKLVGGPAVMRDQLRHLALMSERRLNVTIRIVPDCAGVHAAMLGSFVILDFPDDPSLVYREGVTERLYLERAEEVREYARVFESVWALSLAPDESSGYLMSLADRLEARKS